jgi:hypothetical protein
MMNYVSLLEKGFNSHVAIRDKRPGIKKLLVPLFHEDGDMIDIFLEERDGQVHISDKGLSLMRLSYTYEINTDTKERVLRRILNESHVSEDSGDLFIDVRPEQLYPAVLHFGQTISKITNMALYRREVVASLFYEMLHDKVFENLPRLQPREDVSPLPKRPELVVDYALEGPQAKVYLFGVKERDSSKLRLAAVSCLEFQKQKLPFRSVVVHQDFTALTKTDQQIITNAVDKQFTSLDEFDSTGRDAIERLAA